MVEHLFYPWGMKDFVPERCRYRDEGCDLFPSCLHCPLARCRYDLAGRHTGKALRDRDMRHLYAAGMGATELAHHFKVSTRTVYRALAADDGDLVREHPAGGSR